MQKAKLTPILIGMALGYFVLPKVVVLFYDLPLFKKGQ